MIAYWAPALLPSHIIYNPPENTRWKRGRGDASGQSLHVSSLSPLRSPIQTSPRASARFAAPASTASPDWRSSLLVFTFPLPFISPSPFYLDTLIFYSWILQRLSSHSWMLPLLEWIVETIVATLLVNGWISYCEFRKIIIPPVVLKNRPSNVFFSSTVIMKDMHSRVKINCFARV